MKLTDEEIKRYKSNYYNQRARTATRPPDRTGHKIQMSLTFEEWLDIWVKSGKLNLRGMGAGRFCMGRINDLGDYAVGNVEIVSWEQNSADAKRGRVVQQSTREKMSDARKGVRKSTEHKAAIAAAFAKIPRVTCPHCGKTGQHAAMKRHHFDKCKQR